MHAFAEDALRILRALRFASQLDFTLEPKTAHAALDQREDLRLIAGERIEDELTKLLCGENVYRAAHGARSDPECGAS